MRFVIRFLAFIGFMVVLSLAISLVSALWMNEQAPSLPPRIVLEFDFNRPIRESSNQSALSAILGNQTISLRTLVAALDRARKDDHVAGLVADVSDTGLDLAQIEEVRAALKRFTDAGKFAYAWADSFGELGPGNRSYWLASAFTKISLQPLGLLGLTGASVTQPFGRAALDRLGVVPDVHQRYEYKGMAENLTASSMPAPLRENYQTLLNDIHSNMVRDIAAARNIDEAKLRGLIDHAPLLGKDALEAKLIDAISYQDEMRKKALEAAGKDAAYFDLIGYLGAASPLPAENPTHVALIYMTGPIVNRSDERGPMGERQTTSAEEMVQAIADVSKDPEINTLVIRVDSPGGSVSASESIWHALKQAHENGKYIIVSMGSTAASGGYWIATAADYILAQPSTLTGSIGVVGGKLVIGPLSDKLGISWATLNTGANSGMWAPNTVFSGDALTRIEASLDEIYAGFTQRVADSRHLTLEQVDRLARGRVWTGIHAKELGLVDELGGLREAMMAVRRHQKLPEDAPLMVYVFPQPETPREQLVRILQQFIAAPQLHPLSWGDLAPAAAALLHLPGIQASGALYYAGPTVAN